MLFCLLLLLASDAIVLDRTHESRHFGETRNYRIFLPPDYETSAKRYPVVYFFHGWSERFNHSASGYDLKGFGGDTIASFVSRNDVIVVRWDGHNPRTPGETYRRPYNIGPIETTRQFPPYFPELVAHVDARYRTIPERERRAISGLSMGGFMSFWVAGSHPHLVGSASNFMGSSEFVVGPRDMPVEYRHEEMRGNYEDLRTRLVTGARDFIRFYHRRMNALWLFSRPHHETEDFDWDHGTPGMAKTLAFHMHAFANPLSRPAVWNHHNVYPNFDVWGWQVASDRKRSGITSLENVSNTGFRSVVREWIPGGATLPEVKLQVLTDRLYPPGGARTLTAIRLRDGHLRRVKTLAGADGRLAIELDGEAWEAGVGEGPIIALADWRLEGAAWATAAREVRLAVRFLNKGAAPSRPAALRWESPKPGLVIANPAARLPALAPGRFAELPLAFTATDPARELARIEAVVGAARLPLEVLLFPAAEKTADYRVADGASHEVFQLAIKPAPLRLGTGNGDGAANPGEQVAILLPDGGAWRAAELFTNHPCVDNARRISDYWGSYDNVGASAKISLPTIKSDCAPGTVIPLLARVQWPNKPEHTLRYAAVELRVAAARSTK
jgi:hypothetical protein